MEERTVIVARWRKAGGSYARLAEMLGGVSRKTAWRVARAHGGTGSARGLEGTTGLELE